MDDDLGVRAREELVAARAEILAERLGVVDFTIDDGMDRAVFVVNGLMAGFEVNDREPRDSELRGSVGDDAGIVRPAMAQRGDHGFCFAPAGRPAVKTEGASDSAHERVANKPPERPGRIQTRHPSAEAAWGSAPLAPLSRQYDVLLYSGVAGQ